MGEPTIDRVIKDISSEHGNRRKLTGKVQLAMWNLFCDEIPQRGKNNIDKSKTINDGNGAR